MKNLENIEIQIHKDDKVRVLAACLDGILKRQQDNRDNVIQSVNSCLEIGSIKNVKLHIKDLVQSFVNTTVELAAIEKYIDSFSTQSEAEVLEDLPDLKEDSL